MYQVRVYSKDASYGNAISVIADEGAAYNDGEFILGGQKMSGAMMLKVTYANEETIVYGDVFHDMEYARMLMWGNSES